MAVSRACDRAGQAVDDVAQLAIDRRRVADDADAHAVKPPRGQKAVRPQKQRHCTIIGGAGLASDQDRLIDYRPLVVYPRLLRPRREPIEPQVRLAPSL